MVIVMGKLVHPDAIVPVYYGPCEHHFFYSDAGLLDETNIYAASPEEWLDLNPDAPPDRYSLAALAEFEIVPGTN